MGFGILLLGYPLILSVTLHSMGFCFEILGYLIMLRALTVLSEYGTYFRYAKYAVSALIPLGAFSLVLAEEHRLAPLIKTLGETKYKKEASYMDPVISYYSPVKHAVFLPPAQSYTHLPVSLPSVFRQRIPSDRTNILDH